MSLSMICRQDNSGLGMQSLAMARMLRPDFIMIISTETRGVQQFPERYKNFDSFTIEEMPTYLDCEVLLSKADHFITCETPYNYALWELAKQRGIKTWCAPNWEFFDGLIQPNMPHPDQYLMPSMWMLKEMQGLFPGTRYLPPPTIEKDFEAVREINYNRTGKKRFVHIVGKNAIYDRNGWASIMEALPYAKQDFELVVYSQQEMTGYADPRVKYNVFDVKNQRDLYKNFDALILPRRYGGLCLPMNEALLAGLPVIMTDISPNNKILPAEWLVPAEVTAQFEGRATIDVYSADPRVLAHRLDNIARLPHIGLRQMKKLAYAIGHRNYSDTALKPKYMELFNS